MTFKLAYPFIISHINSDHSVNLGAKYPDNLSKIGSNYT